MGTQVDLPAQLGVDLVHCEAAAARAVDESAGTLSIVQGEIISQAYFDNLAAEVDELLQVNMHKVRGWGGRRGGGGGGQSPTG